MKIKLTIDFSPNKEYRVDEIVEGYFESKAEMNKFLKVLNNTSKRRCEYTWEEI